MRPAAGSARSRVSRVSGCRARLLQWPRWGDPAAFRCGREFAAFAGRQLGSLVPLTDTGEWTPTSLPPVYDRGPGARLCALWQRHRPPRPPVSASSSGDAHRPGRRFDGVHGGDGRRLRCPGPRPERGLRGRAGRGCSPASAWRPGSGVSTRGFDTEGPWRIGARAPCELRVPTTVNPETEATVRAVELPSRLWRPRRRAISRRLASRKLASRIRRGREASGSASGTISVRNKRAFPGSPTCWRTV